MTNTNMPSTSDQSPQARRRARNVGAPAIDPRTSLLDMARVTLEAQAEAVKQSFQKKVSLLEASRTQYFSHEGQVTDERTQAALEVQLKAAEAIDRMTGVLAPPASTKVTVVHSFEWPEWYMTAQDKQVEEGERRLRAEVIPAISGLVSDAEAHPEPDVPNVE